MVMAAQFSQRLGLLNQGVPERIEGLLAALGCPVRLDQNVAPADMIEAMGMDKKAADGNLRFVVTRGVGHAEVTGDFPTAALQEVLDAFCQG